MSDIDECCSVCTDRELREKGIHIAEDWMGYFSSCDLQGMIWREQSRSEEL